MADKIVEFLTALGCRKIKGPSSKGWYQSTCPLAGSTHKGGKDENPSFGVNVSGGKNGFRCFACARHGSLTDLLMLLQHRYGQSCEMAAQILQTISTASQAATSYFPARSEMQQRVESTRPPEPPVALPESALAPFRQVPQEIREYLADRGIGPTEIFDWEIGWHRTAKRIVIPIRDESKVLMGIMGRAYSPFDTKFLHSRGFSRDRYLFGGHRLPLEPRNTGRLTGVLVEGNFDAIVLQSHGFHAVAMMGTYLSTQQIEKVLHWFERVYVVGDGDKAGYEMNDRVVAQLSARVPTSAIVLPPESDPDQCVDLIRSRILTIR